MASLTQLTWVWASSWRWWRTGKPGVLQSMGSQRVGRDWATKPPSSCKEMPWKDLSLLKGFQQSIFKGGWGGSHKVCDQCGHSSLIGRQWGSRVVSLGLTRSVLRHQEAWGYDLMAQVVLPFVGGGGGGGFHICKITQKICIKYYYLSSERS